jgi:hypothetical protein
VIAFLILDHTIERQFRQGWLQRVLRAVLAVCFAWTVVAPWRLLCRLSDWYCERHPLSAPPIVWRAAENDSDFDDDDPWRHSWRYSHFPSNVHYDSSDILPIHDPC